MMDEVDDGQELKEADAQTSSPEVFDNNNTAWWDSDKKVRTGEAFEPRRLDTPLDQIVRKKSGRRSRSKTDDRRGRYIQARPASGKAFDLAFDATLRTAAPFQRQRKDLLKKVAFAVRPSDYMRKVRVRKTANLVLFLVDASWSMAVAERMTATKGAIMSLLTDAYQRRDRVGLIVFQKDKATLVLPPTNSVILAQKALEDIPVGGKTPLSAGLRLAYEVLMRERNLHPDVTPILLVLTDGAGNVSYGDLPPLEESHLMAEQIAEENIHSVVVNMEHSAFDQGLANGLAEHLQAPCYTIAEIKAESLYYTVKNEIKYAGSTSK